MLTTEDSSLAEVKVLVTLSHPGSGQWQQKDMNVKGLSITSERGPKDLPTAVEIMARTMEAAQSEQGKE